MSELAAEHLDLQGSQPPLPPPPPLVHGGPAPAAVPGERTISPVAGRFGSAKAGKAVALAGLLAGCGVFLAATWTHPKAPTARPGPQEPARQVVDWSSVKASASAATGLGGALTAGRAAQPGVSPDGATLENPGPGAPSLAASPDGQSVPALNVPAGGRTGAAADARAAAAAQAANSAKLQAIRGAPLLVYSAQAHSGIAGEDGEPSAVSARASEGAPPSELDQLRRGSSIDLVHARRLPDRNFLLTAGALLPCVLETAIDTSAPGFVTCRIPRDIYSDNGAVVLMEKGSRILGEYRSGFTQGRARIFVLWDRITTPAGVAVDVGSPASDPLGRTGFDGRIHSHFWQRFGGALLLTTVGGGLSAAATADARFANVAQSPNEAATAALQNSIAIPPTLTKPQGAEVAVLISRDLDFASVYALKGR